MALESMEKISRKSRAKTETVLSVKEQWNVLKERRKSGIVTS